MLPEMEFHKPSETFGQWLDPTSENLYGLNFTSVSDAENFAKFFADSVTQASAAPPPPAATAAHAAAVGGDTEEFEDLESHRREIARLKAQLAEKEREGERRVQEASASSGASQASSNAQVDSLSSQLKNLTMEVLSQRPFRHTHTRTHTY